MTTKRIRYSLRALMLFGLLMAIPAWQLGSLRHQYFVKVTNVTNLKDSIPRASVEYKSLAPKWLENSGLCPIWLRRVQSVDFTGLLETEYIRPESVSFNDKDFLEIKPNLREFRSLDNLFMGHTEISDKTLAHIHELTQVKRLDITGCELVTESGIDNLGDHRPELRITESVREGGKTRLITR